MGNINNIIYKKISLEHFKSRVPGLISSINDTNNESINRGNWGEIPYDLNLDKIDGFDNLKKYMEDCSYNMEGYDCKSKQFILPQQKRLRYKNLMLWYHWIIRLCKQNEIYEWSHNNAIVEIENESIGEWVIMDNFNIYDKKMTDRTELLVRTTETDDNADEEIEIGSDDWIKDKIYILVTKEEKEFFEKHGGFEIIHLVESLIGRLYVPEDITGCDVPKFIYISEIQDTLDYLERMRTIDNCCYSNKYEDMGGDEMFDFLDKNADKFNKETENLSIHDLMPYVNIPIAITSEIDDIGVMFNDDQEWIAGHKYELGDIVTYDGVTYQSTISNNTGVYDEYYDEVYFDTLNENGDIVLTNWEEYFDLGDMETPDMNKVIKAEAVSQLSKFKTKRKCYTDDGVEMMGSIPYYVLGDVRQIKTNSDGEVILDLPFIANFPLNVRTENGESFGDILYEVTEEEGNIIRFRYALNAKLNNDNTIKKPIFDSNGNITNGDDLTGMHYEEAYIFSWQSSLEYLDENIYRTHYRVVNYDLNVDNGSSIPILSRVIYKAQNVWNYEKSITNKLYRKDYLVGLSEYPTEKIDIVMDRGLSHAFERHLMLCETNTFDDLKNYKNNYFNLQ